MKSEKIIKGLFAAAIVILAILSILPAFASENDISVSTSSVCCVPNEDAEQCSATQSTDKSDSEKTLMFCLDEFIQFIEPNDLANDFESYAESIKSVFELLKKLFENIENSGK